MIDGTLEIIFQHVRMPLGGGGGIKLRGCSMEEYAKRKYGIISYKTPPNYKGDLSCLAYCIVLGIAHADRNQAKLRSLKRYFSKLKSAASELCTAAQVNLENGGGIEEIHKFQEYLKDHYKICVYSDTVMM